MEKDKALELKGFDSYCVPRPGDPTSLNFGVTISGGDDSAAFT